MADPSAIYTDSGFAYPKTLLASGNVVFTTELAAADVEGQLEVALNRKGLATDVLVRTSSELAHVINANPFQTRRIVIPAI